MHFGQSPQQAGNNGDFYPPAKFSARWRDRGMVLCEDCAEVNVGKPWKAPSCHLCVNVRRVERLNDKSFAHTHTHTFTHTHTHTHTHTQNVCLNGTTARIVLRTPLRLGSYHKCPGRLISKWRFGALIAEVQEISQLSKVRSCRWFCAPALSRVAFLCQRCRGGCRWDYIIVFSRTDTARKREEQPKSCRNSHLRWKHWELALFIKALFKIQLTKCFTRAAK